MPVGSICDIITAAATIIAIGVAVWQLKKTIKQETENRVEDRYNELRSEAFRVDAWVAVTIVKSDSSQKSARVWHVVLDNETKGVIRNVRIHVQWHGLSDGNKDSYGLGVMPLAGKPWLTIPAGSWRINYAKRSENIIWSIPVRIHDSHEEMNPSFFDPGESKPAQLHECVILCFTDAYDNEWCRVYKTHSTPAGLEPGLYLTGTPNESLKKYVKTVPLF